MYHILLLFITCVIILSTGNQNSDKNLVWFKWNERSDGSTRRDLLLTIVFPDWIESVTSFLSLLHTQSSFGTTTRLLPRYRSVKTSVLMSSWRWLAFFIWSIYPSRLFFKSHTNSFTKHEPTHLLPSNCVHEWPQILFPIINYCYYFVIIVTVRAIHRTIGSQQKLCSYEWLNSRRGKKRLILWLKFKIILFYPPNDVQRALFQSDLSSKMYYLVRAMRIFCSNNEQIKK